MAAAIGFNYLKRIWVMRFFWFSLVVKDLEGRYRRSLLGIGWSLLKPLCMTVVFCTVFAKLFDQDPTEYAPFLLIGLTSWQFFTESMTLGCNCFRNASGYIKQQRMPLGIFPLRTALATGFHQLIALVLGLGLAWIFKGFDNPWALLSLIPTLILYLVLGCFLACIFGLLHTYFPDTQYLMEIGLQVLFYLTPILYTLQTLKEKNRGRMAEWLELNPFYALLELVRRPVLEGVLPSTGMVLTSVCFTAILGLFAALMLRRVERTLVFWI